MDPVNTQGEDLVLSIDFRRYFLSLRKYKWIIAALIAVSVVISVIYTNRQTPIYEATATVKVDPKSSVDVLGQGQDMVEVGSGGGNASEYYKSERQILQSYQLIRRTVEVGELHLKVLSDSERGSMTHEAAIDKASRRIADGLTIRYPDQDRVFWVTSRGPDPEVAATIANAHVKTYVAYAQGQLSMGTTYATKFLQSELELAQRNLADTESRLLDFQKKNDVLSVSVQDKQTLLATNIAAFTQKLNDARGSRIERETMLGRLKSLKADPIGPPRPGTVATPDVVRSPIFGLSASPALDGLKTQYYLENNKFLELKQEVKPFNTEYLKQKAKVDDLLQALQVEIDLVVRRTEVQVAAAVAQEQALQRQIESAQLEAVAFGPIVTEYNQLMRRKKRDEDRYNIVVARLGTSDISSRLSTTNVTPLDSARAPSEPVSPSMRKNVVVAGGLGLFFGVGFAFLLVFLDRSVKSAEDVKAVAGAPVLGIIPVLSEADIAVTDDKQRDLYVHLHPTSMAAECCRSLRNNILFSAADRPLNTLVVSSANPREGKTTSVIFLGTTMAQSGQRVLLIDSDMRRPRLHQSTGVTRQPGLSNLILGNSTFEEAIKTTEIPNLFVLPCGPLPPNPAELLMTKRFENLLGELRTRYDRIILDSPPLQAVTDAVVMAKHTDGVILVVKAGKTLRDDVKRSVKHMTDVSIAVTGVILNELDMTDRRYGYYYQYYSYGSEQEEAAAS